MSRLLFLFMRKFYSSGYQHVCQRSSDGGLIFFSPIDFVVLFSVLAIRCLEAEIPVLAVCIMFNHFHVLAQFASRRQMCSIMNGATSAYARMYNSYYGHKGKLFRRPFVSAPKFSDKKIRECYIYICNNPTEKNCVKSASDYRWNFLRYLQTAYPFSSVFDISGCSANLLSLVQEVKNRKIEGKSLNFKLFNNRFYSLSKLERDQFIDFCVQEYMFLDKDAVIRTYGSVEAAFKSMDTVVGSEYDLVDDWDSEDYTRYLQIEKYLVDYGFDFDRERVAVEGDGDWTGRRPLPYPEFRRLIRNINENIGATEYEVAKFFHRPPFSKSVQQSFDR